MFKVGQKVVCVRDDYNNPTFTGTVRKGDVVTIEGIDDNGELFFFEDQTRLRGQRATYWTYRFRPLLGDSAVTELISKVQVVETSDCPIQTPQTA